jgi:hypothetical protein
VVLKVCDFGQVSGRIFPGHSFSGVDVIEAGFLKGNTCSETKLCVLAG